MSHAESKARWRETLDGYRYPVSLSAYQFPHDHEDWFKQELGIEKKRLGLRIISGGMRLAGLIHGSKWFSGSSRASLDTETASLDVS